MRAQWLVIAAVVVVLGLSAGGLILLRRGAAAKPARAPSTPLSASAPAELTLPVRIRARNIVPVSAPPAGIVAGFFADVGQDVYEGQMLAHISDQTLETARDAAKAASELAMSRASKLEAALLDARLEASRARADAERARVVQERNAKAYQRQKMLVGEGATPRLVYEKAEREAAAASTEFESLDVLARQAEERASQIAAELQGARRLAADKSRELDAADSQAKGGDVLSPADGLVVGRKGELGQPVAEDMARDLFEIAVNLAELQAVLDAEPSAVARLSTGQKAMLFFADIPGEGIEGTVTEAKGGQAIIDFISPNPVIRPGMTAQIRVSLR